MPAYMNFFFSTPHHVAVQYKRTETVKTIICHQAPTNYTCVFIYITFELLLFLVVHISIETLFALSANFYCLVFEVENTIALYNIRTKIIIF